MKARGRSKILHASPKIHPPRVKLENGENSLIKRKTTTLYSCFSLSPPSPRAAPARVYLRVYARGGGERVNLEVRHGSPLKRGAGEAAGNSGECRETHDDATLSDFSRGGAPGAFETPVSTQKSRFAARRRIDHG